MESRFSLFLALKSTKAEDRSEATGLDEAPQAGSDSKDREAVR